MSLPTYNSVQVVTGCRDCPFREVTGTRSYCDHRDHNQALSYVSGSGEPVPAEAPAWCPLRNGNTLVCLSLGSGGG